MTTPPTFASLRRRWQVLAGLHMLALLHLAVYITQPGKGESTAFRALAAGVIVLALGAIGIALWLTPSRLTYLRRRAGFLAGPVVLAGGAALGVFGAYIRPEWFYAQVGLTAALTVALAYATLGGPATPFAPGRGGWVLIGLAVILITGVRIYGLVVYPPLHPVDEPWTLGWAINWLREGRLQDRIMVGRDLEIYRFYTVLGEWLRLTGVGLWEARLFTFALILPVIGLSAWAARALYGPAAASFTAAALLSSPLLMSAARIRHDIGLALAVAASLALYGTAWRQERRTLYLPAGICLGAGLLAHYHATVMGLALTVGLFGPRWLARWRAGQRRPETALILYGAGGLLAAGLAVVIQPLPGASNEVAGMSSRIGEAGLLRATWQHILNLSHFSQVEFILVAVGLAAALWRRRPADQVIATTVIAAQIGLGIVSHGVNFDFYLVPLAPPYGLLIGGLFAGNHMGRFTPIFRPLSPPADKGERSRVYTMPLLSTGVAQAGGESSITQGRAVTAALVLVLLLGLTLRPPLEHLVRGRPVRDLPPLPAAAWIRAHVPPGATVVGEHPYYLWLTDYRFVSPLAPNQMAADVRARYPTPEDTWDAIGVDVFIIEPFASAYPALEPLVESGYFASRGYTITAQFGTTTIYQRLSTGTPHDS